MLAAASDWYNSVSPDWFQAVDSRPVVGHFAADFPASSRWVVRLDAEFSATLGQASQSWQVFYPATVLSAGVPAPWEAFRAITGLGLPGQILVETDLPKDQVVADLAVLPHVSSYEPEQQIGGQQLPNDPRFGEQIGLNNTGQTGGTTDADIDAPEAWNLQTGSSVDVIAVIDSGIDYTHPDLAANIWTNPGETGLDSQGHDKATNGVDDDGNGFADDVHGYDFVNNDGNPMDDNGHGTHVAGTIAAVGNNNVGVTGVAWHSSLMGLKFLDQNLSGTSSDAIKAFNYMTMMKTRMTNPVNIVVSNNSWGLSGGIDLGLQQAVKSAGDAGILTVAAAGNGNALGVGIDNDESPFYPASFADNRIISVAASDDNDQLAPFSNFGRTTVDIAAPGIDILSTEPGGKYGFRNGTSMATPHVSGVAALVYAQHPLATPSEVRNAILQGADKIPALGPRLSSGARLNALGALTAETFAPKATLTPISNITSVMNGLAINVHYQDEDGVDLTSLSSTNIAIQRSGFSNDVGTIAFNSANDVVSSPDHKSVDVTYHLTPIDGPFDAKMAGTYSVLLQANQIVNVNGLAGASSTLGSFQVAVTDPHVFLVNTTVDSVDANPGDGLAKDAQGRTSLRAAVMEANHHSSGTYTIVLPDGVYRLSIAETSSSSDLDGGKGDLDVLGNLEIRGTGIDTTTIDAQQKSRALELIPLSKHPAGTSTVASSLTLKSLAIKDGRDTVGGGILVGGDANLGSSLTIDRGLLTLNSGSTRGGAIASTAASNTVTITDTTIDQNATEQSYGVRYGGGGIYNEGTLNVTASTISNNLSAGGLNDTGGGGGVLHAGPGLFTLTNSTISTNTAAESNGGGLALEGATTIQNATITKNASPHGQGSGIYTDPAMQDGAEAGYAVASDNNLAVIGAPGALVANVPKAGAAFVFNIYSEDGDPDPAAILDNPNPEQEDNFGAAVAVFDGFDQNFNSIRYAVVGAPLQDSGAVDSGVAYVFDPGTGALLFTLHNPTPAAGDHFGSSVAINQDVVAVGASDDDAGAVDSGIVFVFSTNTGALLQTISNPTPAAGDQFGTALSIDSSLAVGAPFDDAGARDAGAVYTFDPSTGSRLQTFLNPAPAVGDQFGSAVSISNNTLVVGAPGDDAGAVDSGSAYIFVNGTLSKTLSNPTPAVGDAFGNAVSLVSDYYGTFAMVGAYLDDGPFVADSGAAYRFDPSTGALLETLTDGGVSTGFGFAVSEFVIGDPHSDSYFGSGDGDTGGALEFIGLLYNSSGKASDKILTDFPAVAVRFQASIVADNSALSEDIGGRIWDNGGNLVGTDEFGEMGVETVYTQEFPVYPKLGPLQDNGGPTLTHDLLPDSPGIDGAGKRGASTDQRGVSRPQTAAQNFPAFYPPAGGYDIGAIEKRDTDISGIKFVDLNQDGVHEFGEPGIPGQVIYLDTNENGRLDPGEPNTQTLTDDPTTPFTDETGTYTLHNIPSGPYLLATVAESGVADAPHPSASKIPTSTFRRIADTSTPRPGGSGNLTYLQPPVIGNAGVVFAEGTTGMDGMLDATFGTGGKATQSFSGGDDISQGMAIDAQGRIIVAGYSNTQGHGNDFAVACFKADGSGLDLSFGTNGIAIMDFGGADDQAHGVVIDSKGRIVVAGKTGTGLNQKFAVARFNSDGTPDSFFGNFGKTSFGISDSASSDEVYSVAVDHLDRIIVGGYSYQSNFAVARLGEHGSYDPADGGFRANFNFPGVVLYGLAVDSENGIVAVGPRYNGNKKDFAIARIKPDGSVDTSFGNTGTGEFTFPNADGGDTVLDAVTVDPYGRIVVVGYTGIGNNPAKQFLARLQTDGSFDHSFGANGQVITPGPGPGEFLGQALAIDHFGRIVATGRTFNGSNFDFAVARYNPNGTLDSSFDGDGIAVTAIGTGSDVPGQVALDSVGRIVVQGNSSNGSNYDFALVRYQASASRDLVAAQSDGTLSTKVVVGQSATQNDIVNGIISYDFDGHTTAVNSGDEIYILGEDGALRLVGGYTGSPTNEISVGSGFVGIHTQSPGGIFVSAIDNTSLSGITTIPIVNSNVFSGFDATGFNHPHVDTAGTGPLAAFDASDSYSFTLGLAGSGGATFPRADDFFFDSVGGRNVTGVKTLDVENSEIVFSAIKEDGTEGIYLASNGGTKYFVRPLVESTTFVPGGTGTFSGLFTTGPKAAFTSTAAISNRSVVFSAYDAAGERGIYLAEDDGSLTKLISTRDSLDGKGIKDIQLADGNTIDGNEVAFLAVFDDGSQGIYVDDLSSVEGYRILVVAARAETGHDFPAQVSPAEIHGVVFNDLNRNARKDDNEGTFVGRTIYIDTNGNGSFDLDEPNTTTDAAGSYFFDNLDPLQTYTIATLPVAGFVQTAPTANNGTWVVTPSPGQIVTAINFGNVISTGNGSGAGSKLTGSVLVSSNGKGDLAADSAVAKSVLTGVQVYLDLNNDGKFEPKDATGKPFEPVAALDPKGDYTFSGITDATAQLRLTLVPGMQIASPAQTNTFSDTSINLTSKPDAAAADDFDHVPGTDLAVVMSGINQVWIYHNDGHGHLSKIQELATHSNPLHIVQADLNNDGWPDLVVSNSFKSDISIFINQQSSTTPFLPSTPLNYFTQSTAKPAGTPLGITTGDFNNDTYVDIAVVNELGHQVAVFLNDTKAGHGVGFHLASLPDVGSRPVAVVAGHFTGNANLDLAVANNGNGNPGTSSVTILQGNGAGAFTTFSTLPVADGAADIAAGDLNGDTFTDLVVANYADNEVTILWGKAAGGFDSQLISTGVGPTSVLITDIDSDNDPDILVGYGGKTAENTHVLIIRNQNGSFMYAEPSGSATLFPDTVFGLVAAEFDGKAGTDLALVNPISGAGAGSEAGKIQLLANQLVASGTLNVSLETSRELTNLDFEVALPFHNVIKPQDVTNDKHVAADDVLTIINYINARKPTAVPVNIPVGPFFYDVDNDGFVVAQDVVTVINYINAHPGEAEAESADDIPAAPALTITASTGARSDQTTLSNDLLNLLAMDTVGQSKRRLSRIEI